MAEKQQHFIIVASVMSEQTRSIITRLLKNVLVKIRRFKDVMIASHQAVGPQEPQYSGSTRTQNP